MKQIFFKTVRYNRTSVWAIGSFCRTYKIGQRYTFHKDYPAHVFGFTKDGRGLYGGLYENLLDENLVFPEQSLEDHNFIYGHRTEQMGNRVLIGYGEVRSQIVPICNVEEPWDFKRVRRLQRFVSDDFVIVGEIKPDKRDLPIFFNRSLFKVINSPIP